MNASEEPVPPASPRPRIGAALFFGIILGFTLSACHSNPAGFLQTHPNVSPFNFQITMGDSHYQIAGYLARSTEPGKLPALLVLSGDGDSAERCIDANTGVVAMGIQVA